MPLTVFQPTMPVVVSAPNHDKMEDETFQRLGGAGFFSPPPPLGSGSDDRARLLTWLATLPADTTVGLQPGYLVSAPTPFPDGHRYVGRGAAEGISGHITLMNGSNPASATTGVVVSKAWDDNNNFGGVPTIWDNVSINGNAANNTGTYSGIIPFNFWSRIINCRIDSPRLHHILLTKQKKDGSEATALDFADNRIYGCRLRNGLTGTDGGAIRHLQPGGIANHNADLRAYDNHLESVQHGIWADSGAGWSIFENHIWARRNAINIDNGWFGLRCDENYIDSFGEADEAGPYYGIRLRGFGVSRVPTCNGNRISGPDPIPASSTSRYWMRIEGASDQAAIAVVGNTAKGPNNNPSALAFGFSLGSTSGTLLLTEVANLAQAFNANKDKEYFGTISYKAPRWMTGTATWNPGAVTAGTISSVSITVPGAAVGDAVDIGFTPALATLDSWRIWWAVTATDTVGVRFENRSGASITPSSTTVRAVVTKFNG